MPGSDYLWGRLARVKKWIENPASPLTAEKHVSLDIVEDVPFGNKPAVLGETAGFGSNPGGLRMLSFVPDRLPPRAPLVVVLHGCAQSVADYDKGTGWSMLAARFGFAVLFPEQQRANNPGTCFNWFVPEDMARDSGEALSIRQMIGRMIEDHDLDPGRVGITGFSAGGAMSAVMLACYPDCFSHGAIIAGLPYGCAATVQEALGAMSRGSAKTSDAWADIVRQASPHAGPWPRISIWHGTADRTVKPANADEIVKQWIGLHGLPAAPTVETTGGGFRQRIWRDDKGTDLVEAYIVTGMAHGIPIDPTAENPEERCGVAGPNMFDVGLSSPFLIARSWGFVNQPPALWRETASTPTDAPEKAAPGAPGARPDGGRRRKAGWIVRTLRAIGLMK